MRAELRHGWGWGVRRRAGGWGVGGAGWGRGPICPSCSGAGCNLRATLSPDFLADLSSFNYCFFPLDASLLGCLYKYILNWEAKVLYKLKCNVPLSPGRHVYFETINLNFFCVSNHLLFVSYPWRPKSARPLIQQVAWEMWFQLSVLHVSFCADVLFPKGFQLS